MSRFRLGVPSRLGTAKEPKWYWIAIIALPLLVLWHRDDALYTPPWFSDPWFYLGYFKNLVDFKRDLFPDAYFGSRLSWILPGAAVHSLFAPVVANFILHVGVHLVASLSFFAILRRAVSERAAFLGTLVFSLHPWLWAATGWDYVNGAGIGYLLLAMAALTRAAGREGGRRDLVIAGAALAGMVYAHLFWLPLSPLLPLCYVALAWARQRRSPLRLAFAGIPWLALGFGIVTLALGTANYAIDGQFWFYGLSWNAAMRASEVFTAAPGMWGSNGLEPWLWFPALALVTAAALLPLRLRQEKFPRMAPALLFSAQFLAALVWMGYLQSRKIAMLGFYHYAAYLIPFEFLVIGALFWKAVDQMSERTYLLTLCAAAAGFAAIWYDPAAASRLTAWQSAAIGAGLIAAGMASGRRTASTWLFLGGFLVWSAHALTQTAPLHGDRQEYRRIMDEREKVERARNHDRIMFWYDEKEPRSSEYRALCTLYLERRLSAAFPQQGCTVRVQPGTLIVVPSMNAGAAEVARRTLSDCWSASSMKAAVVGVDSVPRKEGPYTVALLRAVTDLSGQRALRAVIGTDGAGVLELASDGSAASFPLANWKKESSDASVLPAPDGVDVRTPHGDYDYTMAYPPLTAPVAGRYRFALHYSHGNNREFAFGAFPADNSRWWSVNTVGYRAGGAYEIAFSIDLKLGERVILRVANNNNYRDGRPASFRMLALNATVAPE
uniref:Glycosyltransferase RgtA/B/C/D-like domain-containing protein n=1 Tax=Solibacter usitatus (strain Ellin6076) TaxID=234267 RepID=Q01QP1_SOLUE